MTERMPGAPAVKRPRSRYEVLAHELRERIMSGEFAEGVLFPGERELAAQTGRGRSSVREALRVLESEGLLSRKTPGRYGGSTVQRTSEQTIKRQLDLFISGRSISFKDLLQTRQAIEPTLAALAAENRTKADLADLKKKMVAMEEAFDNDRGLVVIRNQEWHLAVASASHNELLNALMIGISGALNQASAVSEHGSRETSMGMVKAHRKIVEAIEQKDAAAARRRMERHLTAYESDLARYVKPQLDL